MQDHFVELDLETDADPEADPESLSEDWMYTEHMIYMPVCLSYSCITFPVNEGIQHTFFVTDHKQSADRPTLTASSTPSILWQDEEDRRLIMRQKVFPDLDG